MVPKKLKINPCSNIKDIQLLVDNSVYRRKRDKGSFGSIHKRYDWTKKMDIAYGWRSVRAFEGQIFAQLTNIIICHHINLIAYTLFNIMNHRFTIFCLTLVVICAQNLQISSFEISRKEKDHSACFIAIDNTHEILDLRTNC